MIAVDTNILIYCHDPRDPRKQSLAKDLMASLVDCVLLWQVSCEYLASINKFASYGFDIDQANDEIKRLRTLWTPILPTWTSYDRAIDIIQNYSVSIWDALIVAACLEAGVETLYSEDINDDYKKEGLKVINPFM